MYKPLTVAKTEDIQYSLKKMAILAKLLEYENQVELIDTKFKIPIINNFTKRIGSDLNAIRMHLSRSGRTNVVVNDSDYAEEYTGALWRILDSLCKLDLEVLIGHAEYLEEALRKIEA